MIASPGFVNSSSEKDSGPNHPTIRNQRQESTKGLIREMQTGLAEPVNYNHPV